MVRLKDIFIMPIKEDKLGYGLIIKIMQVSLDYFFWSYVVT